MAIILAVIKWIGILIGIVLGIVVVLAACVVWVPVRYRAEAGREKIRIQRQFFVPFDFDKEETGFREG